MKKNMRTGIWVSICLSIFGIALYNALRIDQREAHNLIFERSAFAKARLELDKSFANPSQVERCFVCRKDTILVWRLSYDGFESLGQALDKFDRAVGM